MNANFLLVIEIKGVWLDALTGLSILRRVFFPTYVPGWRANALILSALISCNNPLSLFGLVERSPRNVSRFSVNAGALGTNVESRKF